MAFMPMAYGHGLLLACTSVHVLTSLLLLQMGLRRAYAYGLWPWLSICMHHSACNRLPSAAAGGLAPRLCLTYSFGLVLTCTTVHVLACLLLLAGGLAPRSCLWPMALAYYFHAPQCMYLLASCCWQVGLRRA